MTIKGLALAALLAVSANVSAQEITRQEFIPQCEANSNAAGNYPVMSNAVCNCAAQMISYVQTNELERFKQWTIDIDNPLVQGSIDYCIRASNDQPWNFLMYFGSEHASVR